MTLIDLRQVYSELVMKFRRILKISMLLIIFVTFFKMAYRFSSISKHVQERAVLNSADDNFAISSSPDDSFSYVNNDLCSSTAGLRYIICIDSKPENIEQRRSLRDTWANPELFKNRQTKVVFVIGRTYKTHIQDLVREEMKTHDDIVQTHFMDYPQYATMKALMTLQWLSKFCHQAKVSILAKDDVFLNIFKLINVLEYYKDRPNLVVCPLWVDKEIRRELTPSATTEPPKRDCGEWCLLEDELPGRVYFPTHCSSLFYTLSRDLVEAIYQTALHVPAFRMESVFITGMLLELINGVQISRINLHERTAFDEDAVLKMLGIYTNYDIVDPFYYLGKVDDDLSLMYQLWNATLERLPVEQLKELNQQVIGGELRSQVQLYSSVDDITEEETVA